MFGVGVVAVCCGCVLWLCVVAVHAASQRYPMFRLGASQCVHFVDHGSVWLVWGSLIASAMKSVNFLAVKQPASKPQMWTQKHTNSDSSSCGSLETGPDGWTGERELGVDV